MSRAVLAQTLSVAHEPWVDIGEIRQAIVKGKWDKD